MTGSVGRVLARSELRHAVKPGIQAVRGADSSRIANDTRRLFDDSLDLDTATRPAHKNDHRWDYLLGHKETGHVVALEVHPAETAEVTRVIAKRTASSAHLQAHLESGETVAAWYWVASGRIAFVPLDKVRQRLSEHGIEFVGSRLEAKRLASLPKRATARPAKRRK
jgi:hypothetical protein